MASVKEQLEELLGSQGEAPEVVSWQFDLQYDKVILEGMEIPELSVADKEYLQEFIKCELLDMSATGLRSLVNMPDIETLNNVSSLSPSPPQLVLKENSLDGKDLKQL
jgi:hypothetical protein